QRRDEGELSTLRQNAASSSRRRNAQAQKRSDSMTQAAAQGSVWFQLTTTRCSPRRTPSALVTSARATAGGVASSGAMVTPKEKRLPIKDSNTASEPRFRTSERPVARARGRRRSGPAGRLHAWGRTRTA